MGSLISMGFADVNDVDKVEIDSWWNVKSGGSFAYLYIHSDWFRRNEDGNGNNTQFDAKWKGSNSKAGDRMILEFDFVNSKCTASYNGEVVGVLSDALPNQIYIGVVAMYDGLSFETTKLE